MKAMIALAAFFVSSIAMATIPNSTDFTCQEGIRFVKRNGVAVVNVNGKQTRLVADESWCFSDENAETAWVPTSDAKHCPIAYTCVDSGH
jgi:hypothetical protein